MDQTIEPGNTKTVTTTGATRPSLAPQGAPGQSLHALRSAPSQRIHSVTDMVTLRELAERWRMDRKTVRRVLDQAGIRCYLFGPSRNASVRYRRNDVEAFLQACANREKRID